jgi:hypothetical protein
MILYWSIITIAIVILSVINVALGSNVWGLNEWWSIAILWGCVAYEFAIDGFFAWSLHELPDKWFTRDKKIFKVSKKSRKFYDAIKIKSWKDKVWELDGLGGFRKNKINDPNNPKYLEQFIIESNKGVAIHWAGVVLGFTLIFVIPFKFIWTISLPVCLVNLLLNMMSIFVLRYNIPKLEVALERAKRNQLISFTPWFHKS